ncbi:hypothetical protein LB557_17200 [Mesorhizobium sp. BR115XR7A]|uniref:hypothetical protein n=1 Tax=Mesorhizobium sp. BR115XR7A TaxID=2876645 RepID=UPI001CCDD0D1|nr:hypothetical protein [Mesorhizobium sp. BR115XR7A]MBZ9907746.1 hypothetical protein [Mesorhizobium sp. BR115XR7A]MBZ9929051.1 hypothetical protein [Mesorhizobium sp. BR1-1-5]
MRAIEPAELVALISVALGLPPSGAIHGVLKPALRRGSYLLAPCSSADLIRFVSDPLGGNQSIRDAVEPALEDLITYGDILEMRKIDGDEWDVPAVTLRPASPAFVLRSPHEAIILGVAGDFPSALPDDLARLVSDDGPVRTLNRPDDEELGAHLRSLGLSELKEAAWLRLPTAVSTKDYVDSWRARLTVARSCAPLVDGLEILGPEKSSRFYRGRWRSPLATDSGMFVARRPQAYGFKLWSVVDIERGEARRLIDLSPSDSFERGCDLAWRLQAAIDAKRGSPQQFDVLDEGALTHFDFHGPLPSFAERRLALVGSKSPAENCLFRYSMPKAMRKAEIALLQSILWMQPNREGERR